MFYENGNLSTADKELFTNVIDKIIWAYCLKPENTNIKVHKDELRDYPEIEVLEVAVNSDTKLKRIAEIIMRTIPYPMILIFSLNGKKQIWTAQQRINQNDNSKNIIEEFINTEWVYEDSELYKKLSITNMNMTDFYSLYCGFVDAISVHNAKHITHKEMTGEQARELTSKMAELENQIASLKAKLKKETQFNKRVEINLEIKKLNKIVLEVIGFEKNKG